MVLKLYHHAVWQFTTIGLNDQVNIHIVSYVTWKKHSCTYNKQVPHTEANHSPAQL